MFSAVDTFNDVKVGEFWKYNFQYVGALQVDKSLRGSGGHDDFVQLRDDAFCADDFQSLCVF